MLPPKLGGGGPALSCAGARSGDTGGAPIARVAPKAGGGAGNGGGGRSGRTIINVPFGASSLGPTCPGGGRTVSMKSGMKSDAA